MNVLVVDDDAVTRMLMARQLSKLGCRVAMAETGEMALKMILGGRCSHGGEYGVVFLDNHLPGISGRSLVARLRELQRHDYVVGVTGDGHPNTQQAYLAAGVNWFVTICCCSSVLTENISAVY
jgi:CheY-like chemotaxis protein